MVAILGFYNNYRYLEVAATVPSTFVDMHNYADIGDGARRLRLFRDPAFLSTVEAVRRD